MKRNTAQTSINSYYDLKDTPKLGRLQQKVYDTIRTHIQVSNRYIQELTGLEINVVTPRVKELREKGLVKKVGVIRDPKTKKLVNTWGITAAVPFKEVKQIFTRRFNPAQASLWGAV